MGICRQKNVLLGSVSFVYAMGAFNLQMYPHTQAIIFFSIKGSPPDFIEMKQNSQSHVQVQTSDAIKPSFSREGHNATIIHSIVSFR
jgi:hypothetical protein